MNKTLLANIALGHLGSSLIQSIDELSPQAEHCRRMWEITRDSLLRERHWNFALTRADLSASADAPLFGWEVAYVLPADYILAIEWNGREAGTGEAGFDIEGGFLLTDAESDGATARAELRYVYQHDNVSKWDASFCRAFSFALAAAIAPALSSSAGLADNMMQKSDEVLKRAFGPDNLETRPRAVLAQENSGWLAAREGASNW
jgi:hypothetical protein